MYSDIFQKEYSIGKLLSVSWELFTKNIALISLIVLVTFTPFTLVVLYLSNQMTGKYSMSASVPGYFFVVFLITYLLFAIYVVAIPLVVQARLKGQSITLKQSLRQSLPHFFPIILTTLLEIIFLIGLTLLLVIPGIIFSIYWGFVHVSVALKHKSGIAALKDSKAAVKGRWWKVLGYSIVFTILSIPVFFIQILLMVILPSHIISSFIGMIFAMILNSFFMILAVVWYINLDNTKKSIQETQPTV